MNGAKYIAIEGAIGVGKSTLCARLAEHFNARQIREEADENPFLKSFYMDMDKYSFQTQLFFLLSRYRQQLSIKQQDLFEQDTIADYLFDRDRIFAYLSLSQDEIRLYEEVYSLLKPRIPKPDLIIYLQADLDIIKRRIEARGIEYEKHIDPKYLKNVLNAFDHYFFNYKDAPLLIVNTNKINFIENREDIDALIKKIRSHSKGIEYYSPLGSL